MYVHIYLKVYEAQLFLSLLKKKSRKNFFSDLVKQETDLKKKKKILKK